MAHRYQSQAQRRAVLAALVGVTIVLVFGPLLVVPAVALPALVYYAHQLAAAAAGDVDVRYPALAFVIVANSAVVLLVQALLFAAQLRVF